MKYILVTLFLCTANYTQIYSKNNEELNYLEILKEIRFTYYSAVENEDKIEELEKIILNSFSDQQNNYPPLILAYWGGVEALKAKHAFWPFTKLTLLNKSMEIFNLALLESPDNLEIRFLRFTILHYIPSILGYGDERNDDIKKITELINRNEKVSYDDLIQKGILEFMIDSGRLDENQKLFYNKKLAMFKNNE